MFLFKKNPARNAFLLTKILDAPLWGIYNILPFLLYKELGASTFEIALLISLKPVVSLFSLYWSKRVHNRPDKIISNIAWGKVFGLILFLFAPFIQNVGYFIVASAVFMAMCVGSQPAWLELLKCTLSWEENKRTFSIGSAIGYLGGGLLPFLFGYCMDQGMVSWPILLQAASVLSLISLVAFLPISNNFYANFKNSIPEKKPFVKALAAPWKDSGNILLKNQTFRLFQVIFMFFGAGLMILQPALPSFFIDHLNLSYMELAFALSLCKGIAYFLSSPIWSRILSYVDILRLISVISAFAIFFPLTLISSSYYSWLVYVAYFLYGIVQAGSELLWNMSGPIFSQKEDSSSYTSVNVAAVGIRGLFAPALGSLLCAYSGPVSVLLAASCTFFAAALLIQVLLPRYTTYTTTS